MIVIHFCRGGKSCTSVTKYLTSLNINIDARSNDGNTALHLAVQFGDLAATELLMKSGADPTIENDQGKTPLDCSMTDKSNDTQRKSIVSLLKNHKSSF